MIGSPDFVMAGILFGGSIFVFVVLSVVGLGLNDALMWLGTSVVGIDYRITKLGATVIVMVYNFVTRKRFLDAGAGGTEGFGA